MNQATQGVTSMRQAAEPSVEKILDSIKRVIARDNRSLAVEGRRQREEAGMGHMDNTENEPFEEKEVLELVDSSHFDEADASDEAFVEADDQPPAEAPLVTEVSRVSMQQSLEALAMLAEPGARPQNVGSGETSLEGLTRDLLRPILADWLDANLPAIVERMVAAEISRIIGRRG